MFLSDGIQAILKHDVVELQRVIGANRERLEERHSPAKLTLLMIASRSDGVETVSYLLRAGADPNVENANGETALMFAAGTRNADSIRALVAAAAEVNKVDHQGRTALHRALSGIGPKRQLEATVQALLEAGADVSLRDKRGTTPLELARLRKWAWTLPYLQWQFRGWVRVPRGDAVIRLLEKAVTGPH